jgi:hypothetical protein
VGTSGPAGECYLVKHLNVVGFAVQNDTLFERRRNDIRNKGRWEAGDSGWSTGLAWMRENGTHDASEDGAAMWVGGER